MGSKTEPRAAILLSTAIAVGVIWLGDLNFIAPIISMFFLNTYGMVNLIAGIEKLIGNPSFRPRFSIHWGLSLLGALGCYGAMFLINTPATIVAIIVTFGIYFYLRQRQISTTWGDVRSGILFSLARSILLRLEAVDLHVRNWHPNIIVFTGQPHRRLELATMANWFTRGRGIITFFQFIIGDREKLAGKNLRQTAQKAMRKFILDNNMEAFTEVEIVDSFEAGAFTVVQAHGIGKLEANCVMLGWSDTLPGRAMQMRLLRQMTAIQKSVFFLAVDDAKLFGDRKTIHIWWRGFGGNADLMLLLAHLIRQHRDWREAKVRLLRIMDNEEGIESTRDYMEGVLEAVRVEAEVGIVMRDYPHEPISDVICRHSTNADLTFLGLSTPNEDATDEYATYIHDLIKSIGTVLLVHNAQPDEGLLEVGETANMNRN